MTEHLLVVEYLRFQYEPDSWQLELDRLTFGNEGMVCIVGPNGSGKSTLLRLLAGLQTPSRGRILLDHTPLSRLSRRAIAKRIGFLPQETPSLFDYTVEEVVMMGRYVHGEGVGALTQQDRKATDKAINCLDINFLRHRPLSHLSGGERRRAMIASVLAQEPELLLLDEPTASLDIHHAAAVMRLLSDFSECQPTVIVVTHDINLASLFAKRLLLLADGKRVCDGAPEQVILPATMHNVYGNDLRIEKHPQTGGPLVIPVRHAAPPASTHPEKDS